MSVQYSNTNKYTMASKFDFNTCFYFHCHWEFKSANNILHASAQYVMVFRILWAQTFVVAAFFVVEQECINKMKLQMVLLK